MYTCNMSLCALVPFSSFKYSDVEEETREKTVVDVKCKVYSIDCTVWKDTNIHVSYVFVFL